MAGISRLAGLPTRPPTPPKELDMETKESKVHSSQNFQSFQHSMPLNTPTESPSSSDYFPRSSERASKHVDFVLNPSTIETTASAIPYTELVTQSSLPMQGRKPSKSILKSSNNPSSDPPDLESLSEKRDLPSMLDDLTRQLTSLELSARFDAYMTINRCLKAYKDLPSEQSLVEKMPLLAEFIHRDICETQIEERARNTQLVVEAVKLVTTFLWSPRIGKHLPDKFQSFILDRATSAIATESTPKILLIQYMFLLAVQNFRPKIMTTERATRLFATLQTIGDRVTSKRAVAHRLSIYKRLVGQARSLMVTRVTDWIDHLFAALLIEDKEIRGRALSLGIEAGMALGKEEQISKAVRGVFNSTFSREESQKTYAETLMGFMVDWMRSDEDALYVPRVWSMVILFLRSQPKQLERWKHLQPWLQIIEKCFNSRNIKLKHQASQEWVRFIFSIQPNLATTDKIVKLLLSPIQSQMNRCTNPENDNRSTRQFAKAIYCTILYYAFQPKTDHQGLDRFWEVYVGPVLSIPSATANFDAKTARNILVSLFGDGSKKIWDMNRAHGGPIEPDELPPLDVRWIRSRAGMVLRVLETFLLSDSWWVLHDGEAPIMRVWRGFMKALGDAGSKEVKVSMETMTAVAEVVGCLNRFFVASWSSPDPGDRSAALERISVLVLSAVDVMGPLPFIERRLIHSPKDLGSFQAAETPTSRSVKPKGTLASPMHHLLDLLSSSVGDEDVNDTFRDTLQVFLSISLRLATSRRSSIEILRDISLRTLTGPPLKPKAKVILWEVVAKSVSDCFEDFEIEEIAIDSSGSTGQDFRNAIQIIEVGAQQCSNGGLDLWTDTLNKIESQLHKEAGVGGSVIYIIEPLAKLLQQILSVSFSEEIVDRCVTLISKVAWPESRNDLERAQRILGGSISSKNRASVFNPFEHIYTLVTELLRKTYQNLDTIRPQLVCRALHAIQDIVVSSPLPLYGVLLRRTQDGLRRWVEDMDGLMNTRDADSTAVFRAVVLLWKMIAEKIQRFGKFDSTLLSLLHEPLNSGFSSRHKAIVNKSILMWNTTFGLADSLEYPESFRRTIIKLSLLTELHLPGISAEDEESEVGSIPIEFADTPEDLDQLTPFGNDREVNSKIPYTLESASATGEGPVSSPVTVERRVESSPRAVTPKSKSRATPRLRHDDSQIQFAVVNFSPADVDAIESQILTDRQKEVRDRQNEEAAALFPDLRSSPTSKSRGRDASTPRLQIGATAHFVEHFDLDDAHSPILPLSDHMTTFLGSSPTPSQRRSSSRDKSGSRASPYSRVPFSRQELAHGTNSPPSSPPLGARQNIIDAAIYQTHPQSTSSDMHRPEGSSILSVQPEIFDVVNELNDYVMETEGYEMYGSDLDDGASLEDSVAGLDGKDSRILAASEMADIQHDQHYQAEESTEIDKVFFEEITNKSPSPTIDVIVDVLENKEDALARSVEEKSSSDSDMLISSQIAWEMARASQNSADQNSETSRQSQSSSESIEENGVEQNNDEANDTELPRRRRGRPKQQTLQDNEMEGSAPTQEEGILDCIVVSSPSDQTSDLAVDLVNPSLNVKLAQKTSKKRSLEELDEIKVLEDATAEDAASKTYKRARRATQKSQEQASSNGDESSIPSRKLRSRSNRSDRSVGLEETFRATSTAEKAAHSKAPAATRRESSYEEAEVVDHQSRANRQTSNTRQQTEPSVIAAHPRPAAEVEATTGVGQVAEEDLATQLEVLIERAKRGIVPEQRRKVMLMSMELMKMAMDTPET